MAITLEVSIFFINYEFEIKGTKFGKKKFPGEEESHYFDVTQITFLSRTESAQGFTRNAKVGSN